MQADVLRPVLTDVVVALALSELFSQSEWREALELLGELFGRVRGERVATFPTHLVVRLWTAGVIVLTFHHVEHVALGVL